MNQVAAPAEVIEIDMTPAPSIALSSMMSFFIYGKQPNVSIESTPVCTHYMFEGPMSGDDEGEE